MLQACRQWGLLLLIIYMLLLKRMAKLLLVLLVHIMYSLLWQGGLWLW